MVPENTINEDDLLIPETMLHLYSQGAFPMADNSGGINWYLPEVRTIIPMNKFNVPRSLKKTIATSGFEYRYDYDRLQVIKECANRKETWISPKLITAYNGLIGMEHLHSVEVYLNDCLVGGLYGINFRGAFFGESMFSKVSEASKCAFVMLHKKLKAGNFILLDVQFLTAHLKMFGAVEISLNEFRSLLKKAYRVNARF